MSDDTPSSSSSDEDESTNIYSIQLGKPVIISTPIKSTSATMIVPTSNEIIENIKNESIEVIETSHQTLITANVPNNNNDHSPNVSESNAAVKSAISSRSESPVWTYTLPEPPKSFADNYNESETIKTDSSTDLSELSTKPMMIIDCDQTTVESTSICENIVMTSDIEDGYLGDKMKFSRGELLNNINRQYTTTTTTTTTKNKDDNNVDDDEIDNVELRENGYKEKIVVRQQSATNSLNHIDAVKHNVLDELNDVLSNQKLDTIMRNSSSDDSNNNANIESCKPSSLDNFSIQTYSNGNNAQPQSDETQIDVIPLRKMSQENINKTKRSSLTNGNLFRTPRINRSDSFHSTAQHDQRNGFAKTSRSSSYISLFGGGTPIFDRNSMMHMNSDVDNSLLNESNRRKSASELSIADLPSLQSLLVMKSILSNSRLNFDSPSSAAKVRSNGNSNKDTDEKVVLRNSNHKLNVDGSEVNSIQNEKTPELPERLPKSSKTDSTSSTSAATNVNTDKQEKKWKYQGPPSINLSTWGDRPKSQTVIKSDTDYKFGGGGGGGSVTTGQNTQINSETTKTAEAAVTLRRPPRPVSVMISSKLPATTTTKPALRPISMIENNHLPIVRGVEYKKNIRPNGNDNNDTHSIESIRRPSYEVSTFALDKPSTNEQHHISTMTLGRVSHANRFSHQKTSMPMVVQQTLTLQRGNNNNGHHQFAPVVKGFKVTAAQSMENENKPIERTVSSDSGYKSLPITNATMDSRQVHPPKVALKPVVTATKSFDGSQLSGNVPFSQFTLRKTGLKDRILADSNDTKNTCEMLATKSVIETICVSPTVELRQKNVQSPPKQQHELRPVSEIIVTNVPPPPPPNANLAPPIIRSVITKNHQTIPVEPRDQLLDSIRSFNKSKLRRK